MWYASLPKRVPGRGLCLDSSQIAITFVHAERDGEYDRLPERRIAKRKRSRAPKFTARSSPIAIKRSWK